MNGSLQRDHPHRHQKARQVRVGSAIGSRATGRPEAIRAASVRNVCIWRSTTIPVSPIPKSCRTKNVDSCLRFLFDALRFFRNLGVKVETRHDRQRLKLPIPSLRQGAAPAQNQASAHQALHRPEPTARQNASSRPACAIEAYARACSTSEERSRELPIWLASLQLASPSWQYRLKATNRAGSPYPGQRVEAP